MRSITENGWQTIALALPGAPVGDERELWAWASDQGDAFRLAAYFVLASLGMESADLSGDAKQVWLQVRAEATPLRLARALDQERRTMVAAFLVNRDEMVS